MRTRAYLGGRGPPDVLLHLLLTGPGWESTKSSGSELAWSGGLGNVTQTALRSVPLRDRPRSEGMALSPRWWGAGRWPVGIGLETVIYKQDRAHDRGRGQPRLVAQSKVVWVPASSAAKEEQGGRKLSHKWLSRKPPVTLEPAKETLAHPLGQIRLLPFPQPGGRPVRNPLLHPSSPPRTPDAGQLPHGRDRSPQGCGGSDVRQWVSSSRTKELLPVGGMCAGLPLPDKGRDTDQRFPGPCRGEKSCQTCKRRERRLHLRCRASVCLRRRKSLLLPLFVSLLGNGRVHAEPLIASPNGES